MSAYEVATGKVVPAMPTGIIGQISFRRLVEQLRSAGEFAKGEIVTHLEVQPDSGLIRYRVTTEE